VEGYWRGMYLPVYRRYLATAIDLWVALFVAAPLPGEINLIYFVFGWAVVNVGIGSLTKGRTPGKILMRLATGIPMRVEGTDIVLLVKPTPQQLGVRFLGHAFDLFFGIGIIVLKWSDWRQTIGDMMVGTLVFQDRPEVRRDWLFDSVEEAERGGGQVVRDR